MKSTGTAMSALQSGIGNAATSAAKQRENLFVLGLKDFDDIRERGLRTHLALRIVRQHDVHFDAHHALPHHYVSHGGVNVLVRSAAGLDHVAAGFEKKSGRR